jgi:hypothetical protein
MIFHIHSLFPDGDNPERAKKLLEHTKAIRDAVFLQANALSHAIEYSNMLEAGLKRITRKTQYGCMPSQENNLLFACARACNWVRAFYEG